MYFNKTSYYDGAPGVTQCGIPVGETLTYEIPVDSQWGTYWWHSHVGSQYVDGLRAPFIIKPEKEVHDYDDEYTIVVSDWYNDQHSKLIKEFMNIFNPTGAEPVPNSAAIYVANANGTYLDGFNENVTIPFEAGKTYRLRIINQSAFAMFYVWLDGHDMSIIEADGTDTDAYPVDHVSLSVAQRYSVLVTARNDTNSNFLFHANFDSSMFDTVPDDLQLNFTSTVSYGASVTADEETREVLDMTSDWLLVPSQVEVQQAADRFIELGVYFDTFDNGVNRAAFNNITYQSPEVPSIFTAMTMGNDSNNAVAYGPQTHAYTLEKGDVVDLQVINWDANSHPFHLHGHKYQIVRVAQDVSSNDTDLNPPHTEGAANPMRRDTIVVPAGGAVNIRFVADNPGAWIFHCHIEWHLEAGLAVVFIEAPNEMQTELAIPQVMNDQCTALGIPVTGNSVGKMSLTDFAGAVRGPYPQILGWRPKGIGALAGCILTALLGMATVVWYAFGGQLDADELHEEVVRELKKKEKGGLIKRGVKSAFGKNK
ncbi:Cupredoxin [Leucosporidium creatinivorum]|uniref:Cupredoxin n=1 Tax=Leucosporidium creatinivorum TaxID=106004 RepID=A0A1Y2D287_9BASI|nr:Cupredoxin [Leucosporidium creatinivorum]